MNRSTRTSRSLPAADVARRQLHLGFGALIAFAMLLAGCAQPVDPVDGFSLDVVEESVNVAPGESETLTLNLNRIAPFVDAVTVTVEGLPEGITAPDVPLTIAEGDSSAELVLTAAADASPLEQATVEVVGTAGAIVGSDTVLVGIGEGDPVDPGDPTTPGSPDTSLGDNGVATFDVDGDESTVYDIELLTDGSVLLTGAATADLGTTTETHFLALARMSETGDFDTVFGSDTTDGYLLEEAGGEIIALDSAQVGDFIVTAYVTETAGDFDFVLLRHDLDGAMDATFGTTDELATFAAVTDVTVTATGEAYVTGHGDTPGTTDDSDFIVARFDAEGPDGAFSADGIQYVDQGPADEAHGLLVLEDGSVLVYGATDVASVDGGDLIVIRLDAAAGYDVDAAYGPADGRYEIDFTFGADAALAADVQGEDVVIAGEMTTADGSTDLVLLRLDAAGDLDTTFGTDGVVTTDIADEDHVVDVEVLDDGSILVLSTSTDAGADGRMVVTRYGSEGNMDAEFGTDGLAVAGFTGSATAADLAVTDERVLIAGSVEGGVGLAAFWR